MSTTSTTTPISAAGRPASFTAAAVVLVIGAVLDFAHIAAYLSGADVPAGILALKVALGVAALAAASGMWGRRSWAGPLALVVAGVNLLVGVWGFVESFLDSGSAAEKVVTGLTVLLSLAVIALVASIAGRRAVA